MKRTTLLAMLAAALLAAGARAQEPLPVYDVELVVFRHARPLIASEQWSPQTLAADHDGALDLSQSTRSALLEDEDPAPEVTPGEPQRLLEHVEKLAASSNFEVLLHRAWRQPGFESEAAIPIRLHALPLERPIVARPLPVSPPAAGIRMALDAGQPPGGTEPPPAWQPARADEAQSATQAAKDAPAATGAVAATDDDLKPASALVTHTLDGTLTLVRSRFLHAYADLVYTIPSDALPRAIRHQPLRKAAQPAQETMEVGSGAIGPEPQRLAMQSFPLRYHRRMRSNELHYIDHPLLGILILVTPVEVDPSQLTD